MKAIPKAVLLAALAAASCGGRAPSTTLTANGHVEATDVRLSTKVSGRLASLDVREGDVVKTGQPIARIETTDVDLALQQARAERDLAGAELRLSLAGARAEDVAEMAAQVASAQADLAGAERDLQRMQDLLSRGSGTTKARDDAQTRRDVLAGRLSALQQGLARLRSGSRSEEKDAARARVAGVEARIAQLEQQAKDATVLSPLDGVVTEKIAEPGELLQVGSGLCVVTDLAHAWLTVFLPEADLGRIRIGQEADVVTDGGQTRKGHVTFVASQAEFTPKNVQTKDERVKLVYKVKVGLDNADGLFKPGMPAEARLTPVVAAAAGAVTSPGEGAVMVEFDRMTRRYGTLTAAHEVTFDVREGEMFGLIGPDGAGKTTTLRVALGLLAPSSGSVRTCGFDPVPNAEAVSERIGYLSQRFSLYGDLTVDENVAFFAEIHGVPGWRPRRDALLEMLRMTPFRGRLADRLSGGMKQKLALACTLIHTPKLLVLDEPTTGVDPVSRRDFWRILSRLQREGLTIVLTTPYLDEAERCQRVALMDQGRILNVSTPDAVRKGMADALVELIVRPKRQALEWLRRQDDVADVESFGERLHVTLRGGAAAEEAGQRLAQALTAQGVTVESVRAVPPTLEDVFISRIRDDAPRPHDEVAP